MNRLKKFFTDKPTSDFWFKAFIYLIIIRYIAPFTLILMMFMMIGLLAPHADISETINITSEAITNVYAHVFTIMFELGQTIALNNPILSKVLVFVFANFVYIVYVTVFLICIDLLRYFISWIYHKVKRKPSITSNQSTKRGETTHSTIRR